MTGLKKTIAEKQRQLDIATRALIEIAGRPPFADNPWSVAQTALKALGYGAHPTPPPPPYAVWMPVLGADVRTRWRCPKTGVETCVYGKEPGHIENNGGVEAVFMGTEVRINPHNLKA